MNYNTVKKLHGIALFLEGVALLIVLLMTMGQKSVKPLVLASTDVNEIFTVPFSSLVSVIPILVLMAISFLLMKKNNGSNSTTHVIVFSTVSFALHVLTPYITSAYIQVFARLQGANHLASYSALTTVISYATAPLEIVALPLFFLSLGGYYGIEHRMQQ